MNITMKKNSMRKKAILTFCFYTFFCVQWVVAQQYKALVSEDFGTGTREPSLTPANNIAPGTTTYAAHTTLGNASNASLLDGYYVIGLNSNNFDYYGSYANAWQHGGDHTTGSGYMMMINANPARLGEVNGQYYVYKTSAFDIPGAQYLITYWAANLMRFDYNTSDTGPWGNNNGGTFKNGHIGLAIRNNPTGTGTLHGGDSWILPKAGTAGAPPANNGSGLPWVSKSLSFTLPTTYSSGTPLYFNFYNSDPYGSSSNAAYGNDLAIDDIVIQMRVVTLTGTIFYDTNSDGVKSASEVGTNGISTPLYVYFTKADGTIISKAQVQADGTYSLTGDQGIPYVTNNIGMKLLVSPVDLELGDTVTTATPPANYSFVSENINGSTMLTKGSVDGTMIVIRSDQDINNINFGVNCNAQVVAGTASSNQTINSGTAPAALSLAGSTGNIQWQVSTDNVTFTNVASGGTATSYSPGTLTSTRYYRALLTSAGGCTATTNVVTITVVCPAATITASSTTICSGSSVTLTSSATAGNQWYRNGTLIGGATAQTYSATTAGTYTVIVTTGGCTSPPSSGITLTVTTTPTTPTVTASSTTICSGSSVTLTSSATAGNQWYRNGTLIGGATAQTYSATTAGTYTVIVTTGGCTSSPSSGTTLTTGTNPVISTHPTSASYCENETATALTVSASGTGLSYQWYISSSNTNTGGTSIATTQNYIPSTNSIGTSYYYVVVTNSSGCSVTSNVAAVIINTCVNPCAISATNPDTDGDGIADVCDLDDDNDGILDTEECPTINTMPLFHLFDLDPYSTSDGIQLYKQLDGVGSAFVCPTTDCSTNPLGQLYKTTNIYQYTTNLAYDDGRYYVVNSSGNLLFTDNIVVGNFTNLGSANIGSGFKNLAYDNGMFYHWKRVGSTNDITLYSSPNPVSVAWTLMGTVTSRPFAYSSGGYNYELKDIAVNDGNFMFMYYATNSPITSQYNNIRTRVFSSNSPISATPVWNALGTTNFGDGVFNIAQGSQDILVFCDTDGDGIPNHLDLDSDNDGCPDAIEGGASITTTVAAAGTLQGGITGTTSGTYNQPILLNIGNTVNTNATSSSYGVPTVAGSGQSVGTSQTANTVITTITAGTNQTIDSGFAPAAISLSGTTTGVGIQWQVSTDNVTFTNITPAATGTSYSPGALTATRYYRALLTSAGGCTATTNVVTITVNQYCYENPGTSATAKPVKHGITVLGRAGKTGANGNANDWPMVRNSAYTALEGKTKGFVITRIANPETAITDPKIGMMVFDTDADAGKGCLKINTTGTSTGWKCFTKQSCP